MSKSSSASIAAAKNPSQLSTPNAWVKGTAQSSHAHHLSASSSSAPSPRAQSPALPPSHVHNAGANTTQHVRRASNLGQGVPIKDGVSVPRNNVGSIKHGAPSVVFGSVDQPPEAMASSTAAAPPAGRPAEGVRSFSSVLASSGHGHGHVNGKQSISSSTGTPSSQPPTGGNKGPVSGLPSSASAVPGPSPSPSKITDKDKFDVKKLFQVPSSASSSPAPIPASTSQVDISPPLPSPSNRPSSLPHPQNQHPHHPHAGPPPSSPHPHQSALPQGASFPPPFQHRGQLPPHSPAHQHQHQHHQGQPPAPRSPAAYGAQRQNGGVMPQQGAPGAPPMASPRMGGTRPLVQGGPPPTGPPPQMGNMQGGMQQVPPQNMGVQWQGYYYPSEYMPASPYSPAWYAQPMHFPPQPPQPPPPHQYPHQHTPVPQHQHGHQGALPSPRLTPASPPPTPATARLNSSASTFVPHRPTKVTLKNADGQELSIESLRKQAGPPQTHGSQPASPGPGATSFGSPGSQSRKIRMEKEDDKKKRLKVEEERARKEDEAKERERRRKEEEEEKERRKREEELKEKERVRLQEEEAKRKVEEEKERKRLEEEAKERLRLEEEVRKKKEEEEKEKEEEEKEKERLRLEEEERHRKEEEERVRLEAEKEAEVRKQAEEETEQRRLADEAAKAKEVAEAQQQREAAEKTNGVIAAEEVTSPVEEPEEGEVEEKDEEPTEPPSRDSLATSASSAVPSEEKPGSAPPPKEKLHINTTPFPGVGDGRKRPGPLDLTQAKQRASGAGAPLPSALSTARHIENLDSVPYPQGVKSPKPELNTNAKDGRFRYDREFLLQFMEVCKEKPDSLPSLDAIGLEAIEHPMTHSGSGRHRQSSNAIPPAMSRQNSTVGLGISPGGPPGKGFPGNAFSAMGNFATPGMKMTSDERFAMSSAGRVASAGSGPAGMQFGRPAPAMVRSASQGGPGGSGMSSHRTRSKRGEKRNENNRTSTHQPHGSAFGPGPGGAGMGMQPLEPVAPLKVSEHRWTAASTNRNRQQTMSEDSPEMVDRKVKGLLNKLTMERFDSISDQIIQWANKSEKEMNGRTLIQVIRLVFEKATDEATWSEMYARLCRKMMEQISPKVQDDGIKNPEGKPFSGGQLFRKYLLNRCQEDFERGWVAKEATAAAAATKASEDKATKAANEKKEGNGNADEAELYSEEYYAAQKAKRQGLGLIKFIGELFKLQMLTERIMHECIKKLLGNVDNPEEEEIESLCKLLSTVGAILDTTKAKGHIDIYFTRMKELAKSHNVSSRMQFMLQDVVELRDRKWVSRTQVAAPSTLAQVHEAVAREKVTAEKESQQRQAMSRGGSRRGQDRSQHNEAPDGWAVAGGSGPVRPPPKAGDLTHFGKIAKPAAIQQFGPISYFAGKKENKREPMQRTNSSSNMFSMLQNAEAASADPTTSKLSRPPSRKASVDLGQAATPETPVQRPKLKLLPRSKHLEETESSARTPETASGDEGAEEEPAAMSEADAKKKIDEDSKEFFGVRNLDEAEVYFTNLSQQHRFRLVDKLVATAIESKESDARLVADFFARAAEKKLCSPESFEEGFVFTVEILEDIAIDAPKAPNLMAAMLKGAHLDEERLKRIAEKYSDSERLLGLLS